jgi:hypothetical protein
MNNYTELHIKDDLNRLVEVINIRTYLNFNNKNDYTTIKDSYISLIYYLEEPINNVINNHPFTISDNDILLDTLIEDLCNAITVLNKFKKMSNYKVYVSYNEV